MKRLIKTLAVAGMAVLGVLTTGKAQVQQPISFSIKLYDSTVRSIHIGNKEIIQNLVGTNVSGGRLYLVMPNEPVPDGGNGNIGAWLRVTDSRGNIITETDVNSFNIYQTVSSQTGTRIYAWNQFSLSFGGIGAELYGTATWTQNSRSPGGQGSFHVTVSGGASLSGVSNGTVPATGSISGGATKATN